MRTPNPN